MKSTQPLPVDPVIARIADYVVKHRISRKPAYEIARYCLLDALACALDALAHPECHKLLGPLVPGSVIPGGARVPGTNFILDPVKAAFDTGTMIRWLDFNDAWFAAEGGHPSDNLGAVLAVADYVCRARGMNRPLVVRDVLTALIKVYEIQGVLALQNSFVKHGFDSMVLTNIASTAVATHLLGGSREEIVNALTNACMDGACLRLYRKGKHTGWRKSWAAGDATSRGVMHGLFALRGEMGYPAALSAPRWGFCDVLMRGKPIVIARPFDSYIVERVLFKVPFPALFHAQTASECAMKLHPAVKNRIADIKAVHLRTHERAVHAADRKGPLRNAADRDHCLQYIVAVVLLKGNLSAGDYSDESATDPRIDALRARMTVSEDQTFTRDFYDARKRTNSNAVRVEFRDGTFTPDIRIDYPLGHPRRRRQGLPLVEEKFARSIKHAFAPARRKAILNACADPGRLMKMPFEQFMSLFSK
jgi:2-methylcitrate dehydratase